MHASFLWFGRVVRPPWDDDAPVREELFGVERLEQHAQSLAAAQPITARPPAVVSLHTRLNENAAVLLAAYRASAAELESGRSVVPAAEWLLDNYHLVEQQIREIRDDLPIGFYRRLPKLAEGPFAGYPRVFGLAWAYVAHTDSHFDPEVLRRFIAAYQTVQPLTIGELWAVAITLRIVLVENLRRLSDQIGAGRGARRDADAFANRLLALGDAAAALETDIATRSRLPLSERFAAQLAKRLRDQDPRTTPALGWLDERLQRQGTSVDEAVQHAQQRQGASNVTVRNIMTSMRLISDIEWPDLFESVSLVDHKLRDASTFAVMDFQTRDAYRRAIEHLARGSSWSELEIADKALEASQRAAATAPSGADVERIGDPGYHLIAEGRRALELSIGFRPSAPLRVQRLTIHLGIGGYIGAILCGAAGLIALALWALSSAGLEAAWFAPFAVLALVPATDVATALVNRAIAWSFGAVILPGLELADGVPRALRTLVAVPTLLANEADMLEQVERLEVHYLTGANGDLTFALLSDGIDADQEVLDGDADLLTAAAAAIAELNLRHGPGPAGDRFLLLHRRRVFNAGENRWMGWERKRGKLHELNRLLRGADDTSFMTIGGKAPSTPSEVRYVITLDADTRLPRDAALRLIGKMAHPLNRAQFSEALQRVVGGYAILQPRVTPSLPVGMEGSIYQRIVSSPGGIDPYAAAISDVYQDLFGEGSYTGKGIYDVDMFEAALAGRVPDNTLLSHDLFEGTFARAGLASDVEVVDEFPSRYDVAAKRQHRWTRGDWQLLPWIFGGAKPARGVSAVGRGKMLDNLRRSLVAPSVVLAIGFCLLMPMSAATVGVLLMTASIAVPAFLPAMFAIAPARAGIRLDNHLRALAADARLAAAQTFLSVAFLADQAWRMSDAIARTLVRLLITRRRLLEWTTAAQSTGRDRLDLRGFYAEMAGGVVLALVIIGATLVFAPPSWPIAVPIGALWLAAPALALWSSRSPKAGSRAPSTSDANYLRLVARRTWRFFETHVTPADNMLPPDNFQETPKPAIAHRTSPTNIGLYLLSAVAARDFGWAGTLETIERLEAAIGAMGKLALFKGHFFNWYGTEDLKTLDPAYVSAVDSGNLAGHLIALANACEEWRVGEPAPALRLGLIDTLELTRIAVDAARSVSGGRGVELVSALEEIGARLGPAQAFEAMLPSLTKRASQAISTARELGVAGDEGAWSDVVFWVEALGKAIAEHERDLRALAATPDLMAGRLQSLADTARAMALGMDFAFLLNSERKLLSIGYSAVENQLDPNCYDLLASEARLASLFAIAKGDVASRHWLRLGRAATPLGHGSALISWSGSMFEYLMPSLVMRAPVGSLLEQTNNLIVARQQEYGRGRGVPWGVSESGFNARDIEFTYQYSNFGVPGLGLKRGLSQNIVIAPYATGLAAMVDPSGARLNYVRLADMGALGRFGFYEALDFTRVRLPSGESVAIVRSFMAHHQGMTIVAIANVLHNGRMRDRFHREPIIRASELLLQERMPRDVAIAYPRAEEVKASASDDVDVAVSTVRRFKRLPGGAPTTHLLSNGRYAVMLTATGAGYSHWGDIAVTRWREDTTCDDWGAFVFLRDIQNGQVWAAAGADFSRSADSAEVVFGEDQAEFIRRDGALTTTLEVLVSGEDDGEVRRVTLANSGRRTREIELTSYAELVLTARAADNAHPAFAKMFVETEYLAEFDALIATRRPRSAEEPRVWVAHFASVEGDISAENQYESDRAHFVGRNRTIKNALAMSEGRALSNTVGTVLDPIFSLRRRVSIAPGKMARISFWTIVATSRAEVLHLIDKHHDRNAFDRAQTLAWTQAQVQLRHLDVSAEEAADFQRLAAPILYADARFKAPSELIISGAGPQSGLWPHGISGDLPIVLVRIDDVEDIDQVRQLLRAHEYWRMKRLAVDLVIINERASSYVQDLQQAIETAVRSSQSRPRFADLAQGSVYTLRADLMSLQARTLLQAVARVALSARHGAIADQIARMPAIPLEREAPSPRRTPTPASPPPPSPAHPELEFFNGLGGFDKDGREYVTVLETGRSTPAPWINVVANPAFGFQVAAEGGGYTWAENSRENQLTPWSNDAVSDASGEAIYIRDEDSLEIWSPTAQPIRGAGVYIARHGHGYSRFEHEANGVDMRLLQYVPLVDPIKISRLTLTNVSQSARRFSITTYAHWVLGASRGQAGPGIITHIDAATGAMFARNAWSTEYADRVAFSDIAGRQTAWTGDRTEFVGRNGRLEWPEALTKAAPLSGRTGAGFDACATLQRSVELAAGESIEIVWFLGQAESDTEASALIARYRSADLDAVFREVSDHWADVLGAVQVKTPDRAMDIMMNGWLLYQTIACRIWARSAFYQASGAYGFRDQLQDGMALALVKPDETRAHLLRAAARQFGEGDVQHWWLPQSGRGVRTRIADDRAWLAYATATYVVSSGDASVLDEEAAFLEGPSLGPGEHDLFFQPLPGSETASLFEHCARGLDQCLDQTGVHGLPLMGGGDWNDGMNRVGAEGRGESVWLGWLLIRTIDLFAPLADDRDPARASRWRAHASSMREALECEAWDGAWYRRATYDDGAWLGSADSDECRIDSIAQSWSVLSRAGDPARARTAMASLDQHLILREERLALLFAPPFDTTARDPGYIKGYPPGLRENGGQYSHAAMWAVLAFAELGEGEKAASLFALLNPINHARTPEAVERYRVEPYAVAADVYSVAPHVGRGGWTWYTGAAGWMYRAGMEGILGIRREGDNLIVQPCIPASWPGFEAQVNVDGSRYDICVDNFVQPGEAGTSATLDNASIDCVDGRIRAPLDGRNHAIRVWLARPSVASPEIIKTTD